MSDPRTLYNVVTAMAERDIYRHGRCSGYDTVEGWVNSQTPDELLRAISDALEDAGVLPRPPDDPSVP